MKRILITLILGVFILCRGVVSYAAVVPVVDAGNKYCLVGGEEVSGQDFVEYEGKRYGLCCAACAKKFMKNPEKYLANLTQSLPAVTKTIHHHPDEAMTEPHDD